jgi:hypothetical protein
MKNIKTKIEWITELYLISITITGLIVLSPAHSFKSIMAASVTLAVWFGLYFIQSKWLIPKYLKEKRFWNYTGMSVLAAFLLLLVYIPVNLLDFEEMLYQKYYRAIPKSDYLLDVNNWLYFKESMTFFLIVFCVTIFYGFLRNMKFPDKIFYTKILPLGFSITLIGLISVCFILILIEKNAEKPVYDYKTETDNNQIRIMEQSESIIKLSDILNQSFKDKKLTCVIFWCPSCGAQFHQIDQINEMELKSDDIQFIYLCGDYKNSKNTWKDFIIRQNIEGFHYYLSRKQFHEILIEELNINTGIIAVRTLLFDSEHRIVSKNYPLPKNKQDLSDKLHFKLNR